ncbi:MAG: hypothetical protein FJ313_07690, partial [Gemmatimonadetes bacterium]|nr:hypothetical protein [Gemmatimonadota bacterium]
MLPQHVSDNHVSDSQHQLRCADCQNCRQFQETDPATGRYVLKVKCIRGHWLRGRKRGATDLYRVLSRRTPKCGDYVSMSEDAADREQFLATLSATLPLERIIFEPDGTPVDLT